MDALGRGIAVMLSMTGVVFLSVFYMVAPVAVQRNETVRNICHAYTEEILTKKAVSQEEWKLFQEQINRIGTYRIELTIYEQKSYKGEAEDAYLFTVQQGVKEDVQLLRGSYVRLTVTEETKTKATVFFRGAGCTVYAGGRIE